MTRYREEIWITVCAKTWELNGGDRRPQNGFPVVDTGAES